jgi:glycosyltransferase involved in cell wall biosynthesis
MRLMVALGGTDRGYSGIGAYARAVLPEIRAALEVSGGSLSVLGHDRDLESFAPVLDGTERVRQPGWTGVAGASALYHLAGAGLSARAGRADCLLLLAANRRVSAWSPVPTVAVVHDLAQLHVPGKYDFARMAYFRRVVVPALARADLLVAISESTRADLAAALRRAPPIRVVPNGVDAARFRALASDDAAVVRARSVHGLAARYLVYVSRLEHPGKNHVRLVRAFAQSGLRASHQLVFVGRDWGAQSLIERAAQAGGVADRVRFLGFVADDEVSALLAGADASVMVGLREGFGLPALESLATGTPVVVADAGALPEVVGALGVLCDPLDERSIAKALTRVLVDGELRRRVASEGPNWAREFTWARTASGLLGACADAAFGRRRRR